MPSPFPGMDPYLESPAQWPDFHDRFINALSETVADTLPDGYFARIQEDALIFVPESFDAGLPHGRKIVPDVLVAADRGDAVAATVRGTRDGGVATVAPATLTNIIQLDPHVEHFIEIVRIPDEEVVTIVEVLSPTNKSGGGRGAYEDKRNRILQAERVHLVELDLLRAGRRIPLGGTMPAGHYHALISRADRTPECSVYSWGVRDALPTIPIPLRSPASDAAADLGKAFCATYDRGRYGRRIRYSEAPPPPPFDAGDEAWVIARAAEAAETRR